MQAQPPNQAGKEGSVSAASLDESPSSLSDAGQSAAGPSVAAPSTAGQSVAGESIAGGALEPIAKLCCICGLDVTQKKRSRDRAGRYWCAFCHGFLPPGERNPDMIPCPDCGRDTRPGHMVEQAGIKVCVPCNKLMLAEAEPRQRHKAKVTANPETAIRKLIGQLIGGLGALAGLAALITLYHFNLLYLKPVSWLPFQGTLWVLGCLAAIDGIAIGIQYLRIAYRKSAREVEYDRMIQAAANQILAIEDESHSMGISESPEPIRRRVERAVHRVEACAGLGVSDAGEIIEGLAKQGNPERLIQFLKAQRPETADTVARNREIATVSYLYGDFTAATAAVSAILLRIQHDQEAMTRQALVCFRTGDLEQAKKIFKKVIYTAREKKDELELGEAYSNLGMLHLLLNEYDDAGVRYSQALQIYNRLSRDAGQADCHLHLGLIAFKQKKGVEAEERLRNALAINKRRNRAEGLAVCSGLLGVVLFEKEPPELKEADRLLNRAIQLNLELGRPGGMAAAYGNLGLVRAKRGDLASAREMLLKAQSIYQRINRPKMMAKIQSMLKTVGTLTAAKSAAR
jgi:tetratricopeptide (TPR) repeat protein